MNDVVGHVRRLREINEDDIADALERLHLSKSLYEVLCYARKWNRPGGVVTSAVVADHYNTSVASAANKLRKLHQLGYLKRKDTGSPTGGREFEYEVS